ncbi:DHH family phosphoesterase [Virgibacillus indicus]|uniref:DHH family phosphoesterase n=1 Tax=Virgibacillus indicus TaxID=2024554 RepID=A0A265NCK8_9BACI|nr:bifunctional oligoribonuclease/PAP phosphatase NrnA [Virgibacillus indicus]OZU89733.1 DHH family phosphoesterase [Virgibacillus indicus]
MNLQQIIDTIKQYETIIIHRHVRPDPDALGSQGGLAEIVKQSFPKKNVYVTGEEEDSLRFLIKMDEIETSVYENALVIVCDTANTARISDNRYNLGEKLIKIDHHPNVDEYGDLSWVDTGASSTSEMIFELYNFAKNYGFQLNNEAARLLYAGIVGDTGRFLFPSTTKKTFQFAAELVTYEFDRAALYEGIYNIGRNIARLRGYILQNFRQSSSGLSTIKLTKEILNEYGISPAETGQLVGVLGDIEGIKAWALFIEEEDIIRVRLRSRGPVINTVAAKYNGGGHPLASGATVDTWEETKNVIDDLEQTCLNYSK